MESWLSAGVCSVTWWRVVLDDGDNIKAHKGTHAQAAHALKVRFYSCHVNIRSFSQKKGLQRQQP